MIPLAEARRLVLAACPPLPPVRMPAADALGLVLAEPVVAAEAVPPFANSAVDGYAVRAADVAAPPVELPVVSTLAAGAAAGRPLADGEAIRIMTGAPLPPGADAVVMVEDTERVEGDDDRVRIHRNVAPGAAIRDAGSDVAAGAQVIPAGTLLGPAHLGVLASIGVTEVTTGPRLRVGVLSTGDELVEPGRPLGPGQIRESNKPMLLALVHRAGAVAVDYGIAPDDADALVAVLERAAGECDAVITSGGVSMGDFDVVKLVLDRLGQMHWLQIAIKPAKPFAFGLLHWAGPVQSAGPSRGGLLDGPGPVQSAGPTRGGLLHGPGPAQSAGPSRGGLLHGPGPAQSAGASRGGLLHRDGPPLFGLPGNPVSSLVSFELLAGPALRQMAGDPTIDRPCVRAITDEALGRQRDGKDHYIRVRSAFGSDGRLHVRSTGAQGSHQLAAAAAADGLAVLPDGDGIAAGAEVDVLLIYA